MIGMDHPPSRWDRPPATPVIFQNNAPPVTVHVSIAPRLSVSNQNRQDSTVAILGAFVLGMAAVLLFAEDPSKPRK